MPRKQQAEQQDDFEHWYLNTPVNLQVHPVGSTRYKLQLAAWKDGYRQAVTDIDTLNATEIC